MLIFIGQIRLGYSVRDMESGAGCIPAATYTSSSHCLAQTKRAAGKWFSGQERLPFIHTLETAIMITAGPISLASLPSADLENFRTPRARAPQGHEVGGHH